MTVKRYGGWAVDSAWNPMPVLSTEPTALPLYRLTADKDYDDA